jgi:Arm DNA-binding domain
VDVGAHPVTGRRRQKSKSGFATKKEAESALREFIRLIRSGQIPAPSGSGWVSSLSDGSGTSVPEAFGP